MKEKKSKLNPLVMSDIPKQKVTNTYTRYWKYSKKQKEKNERLKTNNNKI